MVAIQEKPKCGRTSSTLIGPVDPVNWAEPLGTKGSMFNARTGSLRS
jgi:hypothetical protein